MTRETLDLKINELINEVLILESMVRKAIIDAVRALYERDLELSRKIYLGDDKINDIRFEIETKTLTLIATQQPMASDLRVLSSVLEIVTELERIGDYAKGIGRINLMIGDEGMVNPMTDLPEMAQIASNMLAKATKAFAERDAVTAREIPIDDEKVDKLFNRIYQSLIENVIENANNIKQATHLQWAAHNIERMADRVTNICERTIFVVDGVMNELEKTDNEWDDLPLDNE